MSDKKWKIILLLFLCALGPRSTNADPRKWGGGSFLSFFWPCGLKSG